MVLSSTSTATAPAWTAPDILSACARRAAPKRRCCSMATSRRKDQAYFDVADAEHSPDHKLLRLLRRPQRVGDLYDPHQGLGQRSASWPSGWKTHKAGSSGPMTAAHCSIPFWMTTIARHASSSTQSVPTAPRTSSCTKSPTLASLFPWTARRVVASYSSTLTTTKPPRSVSSIPRTRTLSHAWWPP